MPLALIRWRTPPANCRLFLRDEACRPSSFRRHPIPNPMHGHDVLRLRSVIAQLFPQLDDHLVERSRGAEVVVAPDFIEQPVAGEDFAGVGGEDLEELE